MDIKGACFFMSRSIKPHESLSSSIKNVSLIWKLQSLFLTDDNGIIAWEACIFIAPLAWLFSHVHERLHLCLVFSLYSWKVAPLVSTSLIIWSYYLPQSPKGLTTLIAYCLGSRHEIKSQLIPMPNQHLPSLPVINSILIHKW